MSLELVTPLVQPRGYLKMTFLLKNGLTIIGVNYLETAPDLKDAADSIRSRVMAGGWISTDNGVVINCAEVSAIDVDTIFGAANLSEASGPEEGRSA